MTFPNVSKEEFLEAIKQGVKDAILTMTESGDGYTGTIIKEPFLEAIKDGVSISMPFSSDIKQAISDATYDAIRNSQ